MTQCDVSFIVYAFNVYYRSSWRLGSVTPCGSLATLRIWEFLSNLDLNQGANRIDHCSTWIVLYCKDHAPRPLTTNRGIRQKDDESDFEIPDSLDDDIYYSLKWQELLYIVFTVVAFLTLLCATWTKVCLDTFTLPKDSYLTLRNEDNFILSAVA